ncbi:MAG TPA: PfkB family carbohydrate kinase [Clostridia bacterium]|nr:PfkB family carbohydrate kinase [Clostridia bacterium]
MKNALVIGSTCVDVIIRLDHLPKTEEDLHPESQRFAVGGCAYNVANLLQRANIPLTFITPVGGQGVFGSFVKNQLDALSFPDYVYLPEAENGCCYCFVEKSGERTFVSYHGVEYTFDPAWMQPHSGKRFDLGYVCGLEIEERTGGALINYLETTPIETLFYAPGPTGVRIPKEKNERLYALHPILHLNASEAMAMGGADSVAAAARRLLTQTQNTVIVTLGKQGVFWMNPDGKTHTLPGVSGAVVDTIGAGDSHVGTTMLGLCRGLPLSAALSLANRVAAAVVATQGATLPDADFAALLG